jgi:hypothetical protein
LGRNTAEIPKLVATISFGRVLWLLEKAEIPPALAHQKILLVMRCAENIARWWMREHRERHAHDVRVSFPGDVSLPQALMPLAIWLGTREYAGIWLHSEGGGCYQDGEVMGSFGESKLKAVYESIAVYSGAFQAQHVWCPPWYRNRFVEWALEVAAVQATIDEFIMVSRSQPGQELDWCRIAGCPYPYVTERVEVRQEGDELVREVVKESRGHIRHYAHRIYPRWGAYLLSDNVVMEDLDREEDKEEV